MRLYMAFYAKSTQSLLVYRLGYGPFKAEGGVRFPGGEHFLQRRRNHFLIVEWLLCCTLHPSNYLTDLLALTG